ncbi:MAG: hypothetical protein A2Y13_01295 [Planctomycetes bacterium GWC2_45_44]|nr:MAG: hypothetical protein A2Y13_01295 [Planctomycetes bacterium GWC2_45_44]
MLELQIIKVKNPLDKSKREIATMPYRQETLHELRLMTLPDNVDIAISVNGQIVDEKYWKITIPRAGDSVALVPILRGDGGGNGKGFLGIFLMIATAGIAAPFVAGTMLGLTAGTMAYTIAMATVVVAGGLLISSMMNKGAKSNFDNNWENSQVYGWSPQTTQEQGLVTPKFYGKNKLYGNVVAVHTEVDETDSTKQYLKMLVALGAGPVKGIVSDSIQINNQPASYYSNVTTEERFGTIDQTVISFFTETKPEYRPNIVVANGTPRIYITPDSDFDALEIELLFDRGIYYANDAGGLSSHGIGIKIEISESGLNDWDILVAETISASSTSAVRASYLSSETYTGGSAVSITNGKKYDIRVTKTTAEAGSRYGDQLRLGSVREVINDDFVYPKTSLLGIEALATDQLSGSITVSCVQEGAIVNVFGGSTWSLEYNTNPAWVLWDILTQPVITGSGTELDPYEIERYDGIDPARLDIAKFYELALFCDELVDDGAGSTEKRITFNGGFDTATTMWEAAWKVCEIARCVLVWNGINLTLAIDKAGTAVQLFSVGNIHADSFKQTFLPQQDLASEIEINYRDELQDFNRVPLTVFDVGIENISNKITLELFGISKQSEAWRAGMYQLAQNRLLKSTIEFSADVDAIACTIGDIIYFQHDVPQWGDGGRVLSGSEQDVIVDKDLEYRADALYSLYVRRNTDDIEQKAVLSQYNDIVGFGEDAYTKLLCHFDGTDADTTDQIAITGQTISLEGTAQLDTAQKAFGTASLLLDGDSDYVTIPDSEDWNFGSGDFTIDFWVRFAVVPTGVDVACFCGQSDGVGNYWWLRYYAGGIAFATGESPYITLGAAVSIVADTWYHIELVRNGDTMTIRLDGIAIATTSSIGALTNVPAVLEIGGYQGASWPLNGWIDEFRISKGIARWTADFTPPIEAYKTKQFKIAGNYTLCYKDEDRIKIADSTGNDGIYTLDGDSTFDGTNTIITVNEDIPDVAVDGGLYNLNRIVVSTAFAIAPQADDVYIFGEQTSPVKLYRVIAIQPTAEQVFTLTCLEYNDEVYETDDLTPVIPITNYTSPGSNAGGNPSQPITWDEIKRMYPSTILNIPNIDTPSTTNLTWNANTPVAGKVSWSKTDGTNPILFNLSGISYEITAGNTTDKYIYWDGGSPTVFLSTNTLATAIGVGKWIMCINEAGTVYAPNIQKIMHGGLIQAGTITAEYLSSLSANLGNITSGEILFSLGENTRMKINTSGISVSNDAGANWTAILFNDSGTTKLTVTDASITSAKIGDLEVDTSNIANNAVTVPVSNYTAAQLAISGTTETTIQSVEITTTGNTVYIDFSYSMSYYHRLRIYRGSTEIYDSEDALGQAGIMLFGGSFSDNPAAGTYTYYMKVTSTSAGTTYARVRYLSLKEFKK